MSQSLSSGSGQAVAEFNAGTVIVGLLPCLPFVFKKKKEKKKEKKKCQIFFFLKTKKRRKKKERKKKKEEEKKNLPYHTPTNLAK